MKKLFLLSLLCLVCNLSFGQDEESQFPYAKMLKMTHKELLDAKFKYNKPKNQYVLSKTNGLNTTAYIMGSLSGTPTNYIPNVNDYQVTIQGSADAYAYVDVMFYDSEIYHKIYTFAIDQCSDLLETNAGSTTKAQFNYKNFSFEINSKQVGQSTASANKGVAAAKDQSYTIYNFTIFTGEEPFSEWHLLQAEKEQKRNDKGKKQRSVSDLM